ncbi:signal peptidase I [uncultured Finegoldia sp.]|uniref:signal peptidase I n=1 Tax=uncultured Finegoldia sp. TaxID=328009 RepID=UPI00261FBC39|nr:signal peptidase I [uncultured Finegoldia sp.]
MTEKAKSFFDWIFVIVIAIVLALILRNFVLSTTHVDGNSMNPTIESGDRIFVNRIGFFKNRLKRGNIVELHAPDKSGKDYIKRIVALPGDTVELKDNKVYVNNEKLEENYTSSPTTLVSGTETKWVLGDDEYFVLGDNRLPRESNDSRIFGPIHKKAIVGRAFFRYFPFHKLGVL